MLWQSILISGLDPFTALGESLESIANKEDVTLVFCFISDAYRKDLEALLTSLNDHFEAARIVGCSASGLVGGSTELEFQPGLSLLIGRIPKEQIHPFHLHELPDLDSGPDRWRSLVGVDHRSVNGMILMADPFSFDSENGLAGLQFGFPDVPVIGGLASGCHQPGEARLVLDDRVYSGGAVGVAFSGKTQIVAAVAQGCEAVGKQFVITDCRDNVVMELDGKPAAKAMVETFQGFNAAQEAAARSSVFVGLGAGKPKLIYQPGDFLVRQVLGVDPRTGCIAVGAKVRKGQTMQFHLRDKQTSLEDLRNVLKQKSEASPEGALIFSCLGRGRSLYGETGVDSRLFFQQFKDVPLSGFFCNGEFGPVGGETVSHGFTSCFALFCEKG